MAETTEQRKIRYAKSAAKRKATIASRGPDAFKQISLKSAETIKKKYGDNYYTKMSHKNWGL